MKVIIAGSRDIYNYELLEEVMRSSDIVPTEIISGGASGVDKLGEQWAEENNLPIHQFYADWSIHGKSAGPIRNRQMAENADALIALWDGQSRSTQDMIEQAVSKKLYIEVYFIHNNAIDDVRQFNPKENVKAQLALCGIKVPSEIEDKDIVSMISSRRSIQDRHAEDQCFDGEEAEDFCSVESKQFGIESIDENSLLKVEGKG